MSKLMDKKLLTKKVYFFLYDLQSKTEISMGSYSFYTEIKYLSHMRKVILSIHG